MLNINAILYDQEHFTQVDLGKLKPLKVYPSAVHRSVYSLDD